MKKIRLNKFALIIGALTLFFQVSVFADDLGTSEALIGRAGALHIANQARKHASAKSDADASESQARRKSNEEAIEGTSSDTHPHRSSDDD